MLCPLNLFSGVTEGGMRDPGDRDRARHPPYSSPTPLGTTFSTGTWAPPSMGWCAPRRAHRSWSSSAASPMGGRRWSVSGASSCPAVRSSGSRSPGLGPYQAMAPVSLYLYVAVHLPAMATAVPCTAHCIAHLGARQVFGLPFLGRKCAWDCPSAIPAPFGKTVGKSSAP